MTTTINFEKKMWEQIVLNEQTQNSRKEIQIQFIPKVRIQAREKRQSILKGY